MENILFWFEFFKDKRFSLRFKLANLIMNDYLRNYLAVGCLLPLNKGLESCQRHVRLAKLNEYIEAETDNEKYMQKQMEKASDTIKDIFEI